MQRSNTLKTIPPRPCANCATILSRRRNKAGQLETFQNFVNRRFCSRSCANSQIKGGITRRSLSHQARKHRLGSCEACGFKKRLHVHHVDEDWTNNDPSNLQTLCVFCHVFWHALHRRLGLTTSRPMPKLTKEISE